ncbi:MAG: hypothetical protein EXQ89_08295 [Rhodospirillaceae bacterium]|nr:hypothetical protein [Rhodospirillaceae bacterium]
MITAAPLPSWDDLLALLHPSAPPDDGLMAPWASGFGAARLLSRSAWSLAALVEMRKDAGTARPRLWLPDFFCNQSTAPSRAAGAEVVFYPLTPALTPDWPACRALAAGARPSLFVLVHYFGQANDTAGAKAFSAATGALLVEDAAHVLKPIAGIGDGDFVLYSPHKLVGIPDGAILLARVPPAGLDRALARLSAAAPSPWPWAIKRGLQRAIPASLWKALRPIADVPFERDPPFQSPANAPMMSAAARKILARIAPRLEAEAAGRRRSEDVMRKILDDIPGWSPWPGRWADAAAPYRGVFLAATAALAAERFAHLRRAGCPVESWPDLAPEVTSNPEAHRSAIDLRRRLLAFPLPKSEKAESFARSCADALR